MSHMGRNCVGKGTRAGVGAAGRRVVGDGLELVLFHFYEKIWLRPGLGLGVSGSVDGNIVGGGNVELGVDGLAVDMNGTAGDDDTGSIGSGTSIATDVIQSPLDEVCTIEP